MKYNCMHKGHVKFILMKLLLSIVFSDLSYEIDFLFGCKIYVLLLILNYVHKY